MSDIFYNMNIGEKRGKNRSKNIQIPSNNKDLEKTLKELPTHINFSKIWEGINNQTVYSIIQTEKPIICLATLSLYRYQHLFKTLDHTKNITKTPLNICLRVQAAEEMPLKYKYKVLELLEKNFVSSDVQFTFRNHGSGIPRRDVVHRALEHFNSRLVMTLDDDILLPSYSLEVLAAILLDRPKLGSITLACKPPYAVWEKRGDRLKGINPNLGFSLTDAVGSGTTMVKSEVFKTCDLDPEYYIGWGDMDFGTQMRKAGWEIGVLNVPGFQALNPANSPQNYKQIRYNKTHIKNSWERYKTKWGIQIG